MIGTPKAIFKDLQLDTRSHLTETEIALGGIGSLYFITYVVELVRNQFKNKCEDFSNRKIKEKNRSKTRCAKDPTNKCKRKKYH